MKASIKNLLLIIFLVLGFNVKSAVARIQIESVNPPNGTLTNGSISVTASPEQQGFKIVGSKVTIDPSLVVKNQNIQVNVPVQATSGSYNYSRFWGGCSSVSWLNCSTYNSYYLNNSSIVNIPFHLYIGDIPKNAAPITIPLNIYAQRTNSWAWWNLFNAESVDGSYTASSVSVNVGVKGNSYAIPKDLLIKNTEIRLIVPFSNLGYTPVAYGVQISGLPSWIRLNNSTNTSSSINVRRYRCGFLRSCSDYSNYAGQTTVSLIVSDVPANAAPVTFIATPFVRP